MAEQVFDCWCGWVGEGRAAAARHWDETEHDAMLGGVSMSSYRNLAESLSAIRKLAVQDPAGLAHRLQAAEERVAELEAALREVREYVIENRDYCRPPEYKRMPAQELDEKRGPCAAYGAVVYANVLGVIDRATNQVFAKGKGADRG